MNRAGESNDAGLKNGNSGREDLNALRDLLLAPEQRQIEELKSRLNASAQAEAMSEALPQAVERASSRDARFADSITPVVESALKKSVRRDPTVLTDAVFPIMGPAIRKAIAEAFEKMIQTINQALEHSLSAQGLKWRFEAMRTGRSFAEVVLSHTLIYRVEQVFLIHRGTGLPLESVQSPDVAGRDSDMISSMLTAIQDFARDSFSVSQAEGLETLRVGELSVWLETSPHATLASVIRGIAPVDYRVTMQDALRKIVVEMQEQLAAFNGDARPFITVRGILESCLRVQRIERSRRLSPWMWILPVLLLLSAGTAWVEWSHRRDAEERRRAEELQRIHADQEREAAAARAKEAAESALWEDCVKRVRSEPGIVVTEASRRDGKLTLGGLRDPLATDPKALIAAAGYDSKNVEGQWEPYYSLQPAIVLKRATERLAPPPTVHLRLEGDKLIAEGSASAAWIQESQRRAYGIPGVATYDASALGDETAAKLGAMKTEIENTVIAFGEGAQLTPDQATAAHGVARKIGELQALAKRVNRHVKVTVIGHTTEIGGESFNAKLGQQRAEQVVGLLTKDEVPAGMLSVTSVGASEPLTPGGARDDPRNRRVTFRVAIDEPSRNAAP